MSAATIPDPVASLLDEARRWLDVREAPRGSNRGVAIDFFNFQTLRAWEPYPHGIQGAPWCASFVSTVGRLALGSAWPVQTSVSVQAIVDWARERSVLHEHPATPEVGDLVVLFYPSLGRWGHIGIVGAVRDAQVATVEGNTGPSGSREGFGVFERERALGSNTAFVRWTTAL